MQAMDDIVRSMTVYAATLLIVRGGPSSSASPLENLFLDAQVLFRLVWAAMKNWRSMSIILFSSWNLVHSHCSSCIWNCFSCTIGCLSCISYCISWTLACLSCIPIWLSWTLACLSCISIWRSWNDLVSCCHWICSCCFCLLDAAILWKWNSDSASDSESQK